VGKANNGVAIFGVGFVLWCERSEHDKTNQTWKHARWLLVFVLLFF